MTTRFRGVTLSGVTTLMLTGFAAVALAQTPVPAPVAPADQDIHCDIIMINGYGPGDGAGMMGGPGGGFGSGMMGGFGPVHAWSGHGKMASADHFEALQQELKITPDQAPAWKTYTDAVAASDQRFFTSMKAAFEPNTKTTLTQDDRFALMSQMITRKKQNFDEQKAAAEVLVARLTPYQSGQAHEILPGLAEGGGYGELQEVGPTMMNFD
ncbi:MAG: hypothetical protein B7Z71_08240, partial [Acidocella sp. 21-58-7]